MGILRKNEVLLMQGDVLAYGYQEVGFGFFQEDEPRDVRRLYTHCIGEAILRFRNANERAYISNIRQETVKRLLESSSRRIIEFARARIDDIFASREEHSMCFFRYLALILDLSIFCLRYEKAQVMYPVLEECERMYHTYLFRVEALPFWRNFMSLCNEVLQNSPEHGRPIPHYRNPAVDWDPSDPNFYPDDYGWIPPALGLPPDHPILKPDHHALMKKFWSDVKASKRPAEDVDAGEEYVNLRVKTVNLDTESSNVIVVESDPGPSNLVVVDSVPKGASNLVVESDPRASNPDDENSNVIVESESAAEGFNIGANSSTGAENTGHADDNSNYAENPSIGVENSNNQNEGSPLGTGADPHPFEVLMAAIYSDIQDIVWNTDPNDLPLD